MLAPGRKASIFYRALEGTKTMELDNSPAARLRDNNSTDAHPPLINSIFEDSNTNRPALSRAGFEELFQDPVIDYRLAPQTNPPDIFGPHVDERVDKCDKHAATKTQKESLESTAMGNSVMHRMYEVAVLSPQGKVEAKDFEKIFGKAAADKMDELGITEISHSKQNMTVHLENGLHYGDSSGEIDVDKSVSFVSYPNGGALTLDQISGITARSGIVQLPVNRVDLQVRKDGYMSGTAYAGWSQTQLCALPDGTIVH